MANFPIIDPARMTERMCSALSPRLVLLSTVATVALIIPLASAKPADAAVPTTVVKPGRVLIMKAPSEGSGRCVVRTAGIKRSFRTRGARTMLFRFRVNRRARGGRYTVKAVCVDGERTVTRKRIVVKRTGGRDHRKLGPARVRVSRRGRTVSGSPVVTMTAAEKAVATWARLAPSLRQYYGVTDGACEGWAFRKRPEVLEYTEIRALTAWFEARPYARPQDYDGAKELVWSGNQWAENVKAYSADVFPVDKTPTVGALMVYNTGEAQHIAYVEQVNPDGSYEVSEMTAANPHQVYYSHYPPVSANPNNPEFIH